jgi:acyl-CoA synthetase (AMP-forming)/AMP-acid ligase II
VASLEHADIRRKPGSVGVPSPSTSVRLAHDGDLLVRGPLLFDGYLGEPDPFVDGWYPTGDLAEIDDEGYLSIVGRAREVIRTGGETVAPAEVEDVLARHPAVVDVAVVGLPDATWGEVVCAVVVGSVTLEALRAHCDGRLAPFKQPRRLEVVDEIPRTASTGQVQRRVIVERLS